MGSRTLVLVLAATVAVMLAACGGHGASSSSASSASSASSSGSASSASSGSPTSASGPGVPVSGKTVFTEHCSVCHSLNGHDNPRLQGGDLLNFHARRTQVVQFVREMPVVHRPLTASELEAVVDYVMAAERAAAGH